MQAKRQKLIFVHKLYAQKKQDKCLLLFKYKNGGTINDYLIINRLVTITFQLLRPPEVFSLR